MSSVTMAISRMLQQGKDAAKVVSSKAVRTAADERLSNGLAMHVCIRYPRTSRMNRDSDQLSLEQICHVIAS